MSRLIITHKEKYMRETEIHIPRFRSLPFFDRVTAKETYLKNKMEQFKLDNVNMLIKLMNDYEIYLMI